MQSANTFELRFHRLRLGRRNQDKIVDAIGRASAGKRFDSGKFRRIRRDDQLPAASMRMWRSEQMA
jgi:hypothetical protein